MSAQHCLHCLARQRLEQQPQFGKALTNGRIQQPLESPDFLSKAVVGDMIFSQAGIDTSQSLCFRELARPQ